MIGHPKILAYIVCTLVLFVSCNRKESDRTQLTIQLPNQGSFTKTTKNKIQASGTESSWSTVIPTSVSEIGCYAVFVGADETGLNSQTCSDPNSNVLFQFGLFLGLKPAGSQLSIVVPSGPKRKINLVGLKLLNGDCEDMSSSISNKVTKENYSSPYILAQKEVDLVAGEQTVYLPLSSTFTSANQIDKCTFIPGSSVAPNTGLVFSQPAMPSNIGFGSSSTFTATITNSTTQEISSISPTVTGPFLITSQTCGSSLPAGTSCNYVLEYTPPGLGSHSGNLNVAYTHNSVTETSALNLTGSGAVGTATLNPLYSSFANWNKYVRVDGITACDGTETGYTQCIHGGEKKEIVITKGLTSCAGVTAFDSLSAFEWYCDASAAPTIKILSKGLASGKGLKNLVSSSAWLPFGVTVQLGGVTVLNTPSLVQWGNSVISQTPSNATSVLATAGAVYVVPTSGSEVSYYITADEISLVTLAGVTVTKFAATSNCNELVGDTGSPNLVCLVFGSNRKFIWIEADLNLNGVANSAGIVGGSNTSSSWWRIQGTSITNGATATGGMSIVFNGAKNMILKDIKINQSIWGMKLNNVDNSYFKEIRISKTALASASGIMIVTGSDGNRFDSISISNSASKGIYLSGSSNNVLNRLRINNVTQYGVLIESSSNNNSILNALITNIGDDSANGEGIRLQTSSNQNKISHATFVGNYWNSININIVTSTTMHQILSLNTQKGIEFNGGSTGQLFQLASLNNSTNSIVNGTGVTSTVTGVFIHDGTSCDWQGGNNCANFSAGHITAGNLSNTHFVGNLANGSDPQNSHNATLTSTTGATISDWFNFSNFFRVWTKQSAGPLDAVPTTSRCTAGTCKAFDFSLAAGATIVRNSSDTGGVNAAFVPGATCPAGVHGNKSATYDSQTFLLNATEILEDSIGDDDGLCENNESCVYSPHFGVYQGEGTLSSTCIFVNGTVSGVSIRAYTTNGGI